LRKAGASNTGDVSVLIKSSHHRLPLIQRWKKRDVTKGEKNGIVEMKFLPGKASWVMGGCPFPNKSSVRSHSTALRKYRGEMPRTWEGLIQGM